MNTDAGTRLVSPHPALARDRIATARDRGGLVTLHGRCRVAGAVEAGPGERAVLAKPDGAVVVHGHAGPRPCLCHPPGEGYEPSVESDALAVHSDGGRGVPGAVVRLETVQWLSIDGADLPTAAASDHATLVARLLETPGLVEPGFRPLATERETPAGRVDVYGEGCDGQPVAVEVKCRRAGPDAVSQLARYVDALSSELHAAAAVRGALLAPSITDAARRELAERGLSFSPIERSLEVVGEPVEEP